MMSRLFSRLIRFAGLGTLGFGVVAFVGMLGLSGYLLMNWENNSSGVSDERSTSAGRVAPTFRSAPRPTDVVAEVVAGINAESATPEDLPGSDLVPEPEAEHENSSESPSANAPAVLLVASAESPESAPPDSSTDVGRAGSDPDDTTTAGAASPGSGIPAIPHPTQGRDGCTLCHTVGGPDVGAPGGTGLPASHAGRSDTACQTCHTSAVTPVATQAALPAIDAPSILHPVQGMEGCTSCHAVGGAGRTALPANHEGRGDSLCQACHTTVQIPPASTPGAATVTPAIRHAIQGMESCTTCHSVGGSLVGAPGGAGMPASHQGRTDMLCQACHTRVEVAAMPAASAIAGAPTILHPTQGMEACASCHSVGGRGVGADGGTGLPANHEGRGDSLCQVCHTTVQTPPATTIQSTSAPAILHSTQGMQGCTGCHSVGGSGVDAPGGIGLPSDHQGRGDLVCRSCHTTVQVPPTSTPPAVAKVPAILHSTQGREACTSCHLVGGSGVGVPAGTGLPASHQGRADATCQSCHTTVQVPPTATPGATATPGPSTTPVPTATPGAGGTAPIIPHTLQGRQACAGCHTVGGPGVGVEGGTGLASSHQGRTDASCQGCHSPAQPAATPSPTSTPLPTSVPPVTATPSHTSVPSVTATPSRTATPGLTATPVPTFTPTSSPTPLPTSTRAPVSTAPALLHSTQGRLECTGCHTVGGSGVGVPGGRGLPASHQGRTDAACLSCHATIAASSSLAVAKPTATPRKK